MDYTSKIKDICDSLASIEVNIEESDMVQVSLGGLASKFRAFRTAVCTRENTPSFFDLQSMLLVEENHAGAVARVGNTVPDPRLLKARLQVIVVSKRSLGRGSLMRGLRIRRV